LVETRAVVNSRVGGGKRLAEVFSGEVSAADRAQLEPDLEDAVDAAFVRGQQAFPQLPLGNERFARHLGQVLARNPEATPLSSLFAADLYLACACLAGAAGAAEALTAGYGTAIRRGIGRVVRGPDAAEIEQEMLTGLFVGSPVSPPELASYAGRAPLARWLEVVAHHAALRWLRAERAQGKVGERAAAQPPPVGETPAESNLLRARYRDDFEQALRAALGRAPERDRALLRLSIVNNVSLAKIGRMLGVDQSTASRWLAAAREALLVDLKAILRERLQISSIEIASLAGLVANRLDLSLSTLLKTD
jgi:RNA polymerase sigma-70 factor (ECF subfamily)